MHGALGLAGFSEADMAAYANTVAMMVYKQTDLNWIAGDCANDGRWATTGETAMPEIQTGFYRPWTGSGGENYIRRVNGGGVVCHDASPNKDTVRVMARHMNRLGGLESQYPTFSEL